MSEPLDRPAYADTRIKWPSSVKAFQDFLEKVNKGAITNSLPVQRRPLNGQVIPVPDQSTNLDPVTEVAQVQRMINNHNAASPHNRLHIRRQVFYTGYLLEASGTANLLSLIPLPSSAHSDSSNIKLFGTNIMIAPRAASQTALDKVGGLGAKQVWQVSATGCYQNSVWAARVVPVPPSAQFFTEAPLPIVVLACRRGAKTADANLIKDWTPVPSERQYVFATTVGEKAQLRVRPENAPDDEPEFAGMNRRGGPNGVGNRRRGQDDGDDRRDDHRRASGGYRGGNANRGRGGGDRHRNDPYPRGGRGGGNRRGGGGGGGGGGPRRDRNRGAYKSLDDVPNGHRNHERDPREQDYMPLDPIRGGGGGPGMNVAGRNMYDDGGLPYQ